LRGLKRQTGDGDAWGRQLAAPTRTERGTHHNGYRAGPLGIAENGPREAPRTRPGVRRFAYRGIRTKPLLITLGGDVTDELLDKLWSRLTGRGLAKVPAGVALLVLNLGAAAFLLLLAVDLLLAAALPWIGLFSPEAPHDLLGPVYESRLWSLVLPTVGALYQFASLAIITALVWVFALVLQRESAHWWVPDTIKFTLCSIGLAVVWIVVSFAAMYRQAEFAHAAGAQACFAHDAALTPLDSVYFSAGALSTGGSSGLEVHSQLCRGIATGELAITVPLLILALSAVGARLLDVSDRRVTTPLFPDQVATSESLAEPVELVLAALSFYGALSLPELLALTGLERKSAIRVLGRLVKSRQIEKVPRAYRRRGGVIS
jgi:hypothetical protein